MRSDGELELPGAVPGEQLPDVQVGARERLHDTVPRHGSDHLQWPVRQHVRRRAVRRRTEWRPHGADQRKRDRNRLVGMRRQHVQRTRVGEGKGVVRRSSGRQYERPLLGLRCGGCGNDRGRSSPRATMNRFSLAGALRGPHLGSQQGRQRRPRLGSQAA
jgi:hypothetical protein